MNFCWISHKTLPAHLRKRKFSIHLGYAIVSTISNNKIDKAKVVKSEALHFRPSKSVTDFIPLSNSISMAPTWPCFNFPAQPFTLTIRSRTSLCFFFSSSSIFLKEVLVCVYAMHRLLGAGMFTEKKGSFVWVPTWWRSLLNSTILSESVYVTMRMVGSSIVWFMYTTVVCVWDEEIKRNWDRVIGK